jgi:hypothetical protein
MKLTFAGEHCFGVRKGSYILVKFISKNVGNIGCYNASPSCLGFFGQSDTNRTYSFCVASPKVTKGSKVLIFVA